MPFVTRTLRSLSGIIWKPVPKSYTRKCVVFVFLALLDSNYARRSAQRKTLRIRMQLPHSWWVTISNASSLRFIIQQRQELAQKDLMIQQEVCDTACSEQLPMSLLAHRTRPNHWRAWGYDDGAGEYRQLSWFRWINYHLATTTGRIQHLDKGRGSITITSSGTYLLTHISSVWGEIKRSK